MFNQTHYLAMHTVLKTWFLVRSFLWVWVKSLKPKNDETVVGPERYPKNPNPYHESSILGAAVPVLSGFFLLPRSDVPTYRLGKKKKNMVPPTTSTAPKKSLTIFQVAMQEISLVATVSPVLAIGEKNRGKTFKPSGSNPVLYVKNYPCYLGRRRPHVAWYQPEIGPCGCHNAISTRGASPVTCNKNTSSATRGTRF